MAMSELDSAVEAEVVRPSSCGVGSGEAVVGEADGMLGDERGVE